MTRGRHAAVVVIVAAALAGCGTPKEKTAPCKRPANLLSYASEPVARAPASGCGPMLPVNTVPNSADEAIDRLSTD